MEQLGAPPGDDTSGRGASRNSFQTAAPAITMPKGGGAIRGMGEKFSANPVTGTGSMVIPVATSPGRSGFGPQLSLAYDSGAGNGPFGVGWHLSLPSITRKTDRGLPEYQDASESDVFVLSGAEDLVPTLTRTADGRWVPEVVPPRTINGATYLIKRYRPRVEGMFARIERWTDEHRPEDTFWRSISKDNVTTWYGRSDNSRLADPADRSRVFSWLVCESHDDKGNAIVYEYKAEDSQRIFESRAAHERNRTDSMRATNRYLKRIHYGNREPYLPALEPGQPWPAPPSPGLSGGKANWFFEVVFDYEDGHYAEDAADADGCVFARPMHSPPGTAQWTGRMDAFSTYRAGFEVRTYRLCRRVLMFHHLPDELGTPDCLVTSTDITYAPSGDPKDARHPTYSFVAAVRHSGYTRQINGSYLKKSLPPVEFEYTQPVVQDAVHEVAAESLENLPSGVSGAACQWTDLHGEGSAGILTEQAGAWFYKRNVSAAGRDSVEFAPLERVALKPNVALGGGAQLMDLAGNGRPDLVMWDGPTPGLYEQDDDEGWRTFRPFTAHLRRDLRDPQLRLVDLNGDGHADVLITEDDTFVWHASLAEKGFGPASRVPQARDEEQGPRIVFADSTQAIYLADLSGDGLTDLVRLRNGEVCYWPNLGYGRFGAKVTMDQAPYFDNPDRFDHARIRLADIDGSGTTDIIYLHSEGVRLYFNQSGNSWSRPHQLTAFPRVDDVVSVVPTDLLGNGTACLVWSSPLGADTRQPMRYVNLMGGGKPHLLVRSMNNLGAETRVDYAPSTRFYLRDKRAGRPWISRLPFPVHVVERVETLDHLSRNRFVTRYAYHHGHFDGGEREFRGFGMVEQWDTEEPAALTAAGTSPSADKVTAESYVPPVHTRTWFHTGVHAGRDHVSDYFAGTLNDTDAGEYFREPGATDIEARALLLPDTVLPPGLSGEEEREACRALKGLMLRREVYADDAGPRAGIPYTVTEQNFSIRAVQSRGTNPHAVFITDPQESVSYHYERDPADPRIQHVLTLEVDLYGNVLKQAAIGYGRRAQIRVAGALGQVLHEPNPGLAVLTADDQAKQTTPLLTYTESRVTNAVESLDAHRNPLPCQAVTYELTGYPATGPAGRFRAADLVRPEPGAGGGLRHEFADEVAYEDEPSGQPCRRPIESQRVLYRSDDLAGLLPLGSVQPLGLPGETYRLAFTSGLLAEVYRRPRAGGSVEPLLPDPAAVLDGQAGDRGGYVRSETLKADGRFPASDADGHWWIPSGRSYFIAGTAVIAGTADDAARELAQARQHFFLPRRYRDPFGEDTLVDLDRHDLLTVETRDAVGNRVTVDASDYRVLKPRLISDPNRNRTEVVFDALGMVVGTAVMGKPLPATPEGDSLAGFVADLTDPQLTGLFDVADPHTGAAALLDGATTRIVYDLDRFRRTRTAHPGDPARWEPTCAATLARETHLSAPLPPHGLKIQLSFMYTDGFGRVIQTKSQAEPERTNGIAGPPRWVGSGWTIFNNKGRPVRRYEPFFSRRRQPNGAMGSDHRFEFGVMAGVSAVLFYDPAERVIATLHPNHTYEKVVFDPWRQITYDVNDTCAPRNPQTGDPRTDPDIRGHVAGHFATRPAPSWQTWYEQRVGGALGPHEQAAAARAAAHADTPATAHFDTLGRPFLTVAANRVSCAGHDLDGTEDSIATRVDLDIEGNQRLVRDERRLPVDHLPTGTVEQRVVMRLAYDMVGTPVHHLSMEAGARWFLNDATGRAIRSWDSRGHHRTTTYDALRRPVEQTLWDTSGSAGLLVDKIEYGEPPPDASQAAQHRATDLNLRTRVYRHFDSAGIVTNAGLDADDEPLEAYDFKGNLVRSTRRLASDYSAIPDWRQDPGLQAETFAGRTRYDALNRPVQSIAPRSSLTGDKVNVIQPVFNEANLLERVDVWLERPNEPTGLLDPNTEAPSLAGVANIDYDAKGQRLGIHFKNGAGTAYRYDVETSRLTHLYTRRGAAFTDDCDNPQPPPPTVAAPAIPPQGKACGLQNLHYTYDPAGNITHIQDDAQQTIFFRNQRVEPSNDYTYDALYRLIQASGREHLGQDANGDRKPPTAPDGFNAFHTRRDHPNMLKDMGRYVERYVYDAVGNVLQTQHRGSDPAHAGWTRAYDYLAPSLIEDGIGGAPQTSSNRLTGTTSNPFSGSPSLVELYQHDAHGNMVRMPHLGGGAAGPNMRWDYREQLRQIDMGNGVAAFYVYDASGRRVRKVWEKAPGRIEERIFLGGFEIFRRHDDSIGADTAVLERETLHVMDDRQRIALVELRTLDTAGDDRAPRRQIRYQLGDRLGSAALELDEQAQIISYEEYTPYGSSTYQAVRSETETPKRYRYTGKERDEESGLSYHGARYSAPWLGRWISADPMLLDDGVNVYCYCLDSPVRYRDPDGGSAVEDLFKFLRDTGGFEAARMPNGGPPQFSTGHASPFGTAGHQAITTTLDEIKGMGSSGFKGFERIYSEVAIRHGTNTVTKIGGSPIKGHHNIDLVAMHQGQTLAEGQTLNLGAAEAVGDAKFGRGSISTAHSAFGQRALTVNGASAATAGPSLGAASESEQAFSALAQELAAEPAAAKGATSSTGASFDVNVARAQWKALQAGRPNAVLASLKSGAAKALGLLGGVASVAGAGVAGYQVGTGIDEVMNGATGAGATDIVGGSAQLGISIGVPAAAKAGAVVGAGAGALALVSGLAAASVGWAVEDTKRALAGKRTLTDESVDYWSKNGVSKTFQDLWWQIKN